MSTAMVRGADNWDGAFEYIMFQLFLHDYSDPFELHKVKMKLWVLDGQPLIEQGGNLIDTDVLEPLDHFSSLLNELNFLDRYVRTVEGTLEENEEDFSGMYSDRIQAMESWLEGTNYDTGEPNKDYEVSYNSRPSLLTEEQFSILYQYFVLKREAGQLTTASSIVYAATDHNIDSEARRAELAILNYVPPAEAEARILEQAVTRAHRDDIHYVTEMQRAWAEMWSIIASMTVPDIEPPSETIDIPPVNPGDPWTEGPNPESWEDTQLVVVKLPQDRTQIGLVAGDPSHKGLLIIGGGYRYTYHDASTGQPISFAVPPVNTPGDLLIGDEEKDQLDFAYALYYIYSNTDSGTTEARIVYFGPNRGDLPSGATSVGSKTKERFDILAERWTNLNMLREYEIANMGTRSVIEAMLNAQVPDHLPDRLAHLEENKAHKNNYTDTLRNICPEFI